MYFTAYYDRSGRQDEVDRPLVSAAVLSTVDRWLAFDKEWNAALGDYGVAYLHVKEFNHGIGAYEPWKDDKPKRAKFIDRLVRIAKRAVPITFGLRVTPNDFHAVNNRYRLADGWLETTPYSFLSTSIVGRVEKWADENHPGEPLQHVFESGDYGQGPLSKLTQLRWLNLSIQPAFNEKTGCYVTPFQVADFVAYELRTHVERRIANSPIPARGSYRARREAVSLEMREFDQRGLFQMCRENPEMWPRRETPPT